MNSFNIFSLLVLAVAVVSPCFGASENSRSDAQRQSLKHLYFRGSPMPPAMTLEEKESTLRLLKTRKPKREVDILKKQFGSSYDLITFATRDSDHDGVLDFRFHLEDGRFFEGDVDVDGDGVLNVYDVSPFDPKIGGRDLNADGVPDRDFLDSNKNQIPDHVDWTILKKSQPDGKKLAQIQTDLFQNHSIILVDRTSVFNLVGVTAVFDTIKKVYRKTFFPQKILPTLRVISAENYPLLFEEDPVETDAMYHAAARTLMLYRHSFKAHPLIQLGLAVHEIGHTIQYAMDYDSQSPREENRRNFYMSPNLLQAMHPFGWSALPKIDKWEDFEIISPMYDVGYPEYFLHGKSTEEWENWLEDIRNEVGEEFMLDPRVVRAGVVGTYSLSNIWEWLSDNEIAYVYLLTEKQALRQTACSFTSAATLRKRMQGKIERFWPDFYFGNVEKSKLATYLLAEMPISKKDLAELAKAYVGDHFCK